MIVNGEFGRSSSIIYIPNNTVDRHRESDSKSTSGRCECYWYCDINEGSPGVVPEEGNHSGIQ